jgi:hypothetical protein
MHKGKTGAGVSFKLESEGKNTTVSFTLQGKVVRYTFGSDHKVTREPL